MATLICPSCGSVVHKHAKSEGICLNGHGVVAVNEFGHEVILKPVTIRQVGLRS